MHRCLLLVLAAWSVPFVASGAEWAHLRGRVIYDGQAPAPRKITPDKDQEVCGKFDLFDESLVVHPENHGIRDVIIMLQLERGESIDVHESYQPHEKAEVLLNSLHCRFDPHVTLLRTTQKLVLRNQDPKGDNVKIDMRKNLSINVTIPSGTSHTHEFPKPEALPARVSCSIHTWELGWLVVKEHPYMAVTDEDGRFEIRNLPLGKRQFMFWQEEAGYLREVTVNGKATAWNRGTVTLELKSGDNDLGDIVVQPALFRR